MNPDAAEMVDPAFLSQSMMSIYDFRCLCGIYYKISTKTNQIKGKK